MKVIKEAIDVLDFNYGLSYHLLLGNPETLQEFLEENIISFGERVGGLEYYSIPEFAEKYVTAEIKAQVEKQTISAFTEKVRQDTCLYLARCRSELSKSVSIIISEKAVDLLLRLITLYTGKGAKPCKYDVTVFESLYSSIESTYQKGSKEMHTEEILRSIHNKISSMLSALEQ